MKTMLKLFGYIFGLGALILLSLHLFLLFGLTTAMREVVLPRIQAETGIDVRVGRLSLNIPNGIIYFKEVEIRNPDGFLLENLASVERVEVEVDIQSLFKKNPIVVRNVEVENALLNVIRNKEGEINLAMLQESARPMSVEPVPEPETLPFEKVPETGRPAPQLVEPKPLPEVLLEALVCNAQVRYLDFRLDQLDLTLNLRLLGRGLSTQRGAPWGDLSIRGSLGDNRTSFVTDLLLHLAPLIDFEAPSFDLTGKVMEIDPRIMEEAYSKMGIRSAPFGFDPELHCRAGYFKNSAIALNLKNIELEDKLSDRLGGMGTIGSLRLVVPVEGSLQEPVVDIQSSLMSAIGGNVGSLLDAFLQGSAEKEFEDKPATQKVLKDLVEGSPSATNAPSSITSDVLVDILGEHLDELGEDEALKKDLKQLGNWLFGN